MFAEEERGGGDDKDEHKKGPGQIRKQKNRGNGGKRTKERANKK